MLLLVGCWLFAAVFGFAAVVDSVMLERGALDRVRARRSKLSALVAMGSSVIGMGMAILVRQTSDASAARWLMVPFLMTGAGGLWAWLALRPDSALATVTKNFLHRPVAEKLYVSAWIVTVAGCTVVSSLDIDVHTARALAVLALLGALTVLAYLMEWRVSGFLRKLGGALLILGAGWIVFANRDDAGGPFIALSLGVAAGVLGMWSILLKASGERAKV